MKRFGLLVSILALAATPLLGQADGQILTTPLAPAGRTPAPDAFGINSLTSVTINQWVFEPLTDNATWANNFTGSRYLVSGTNFWRAPVELPTGVRLAELELQGCDNALTDMVVTLFVQSVNGSNETAASLGQVSSVGNTDCWYWQTGLDHTVDSYNNTYFLQIEQPANDGSHIAQAVRIRYQRQLSPAPGSATFDDVPTTHPLFQFVEALVASGITAGCDANNFCPNASLTRGQMAVFLAKALGLHWPN